MGAHTSQPIAEEIQRVLDGLRRLIQALRESARAVEKTTGLTAAQSFVLSRLADSQPASINDLAAQTFTHQSSVSVVVSRLVQKGFIEERKDPLDGRRKLLTLSQAGRKAVTSAPASAQDKLIEAVLTMPAAERRLLGQALETIGDAMMLTRMPPMLFEQPGRR